MANRRKPRRSEPPDTEAGFTIDLSGAKSTVTLLKAIRELRDEIVARQVTSLDDIAERLRLIREQWGDSVEGMSDE